MAGCKVDCELSPDFKKLRDSWKRSLPHIVADLKEAFSEIEKNILANRGRRVHGGQRLDLYKYRQNSSDIRRGARYGWRIYCLYDRAAGKMYPIIVYPKTCWEDADTQTVIEAIKEIKLRLGHCTAPECDGHAVPVYPEEIKPIGDVPHIKIRCEKCRSVVWREHLETT